MELDYTQVRPVELKADMATSLILRRPRKINTASTKRTRPREILLWRHSPRSWVKKEYMQTAVLRAKLHRRRYNRARGTRLPLGGITYTQRQLTDEMRAQFVFDTSRGMSYLHQFELPILDRDMKSPNLLVERDFSIKISDFGLSRVMAQIQTDWQLWHCVMDGTQGVWQPQVYGKEDVFSFSIVVWEIFMGQCPY
ncbi:hypothetical protein PsorP6_001582 [Peronosclerospora sorghi]|uniref:Uncharacterized protein n=1 Tax=Peronosclerospora sorghi TaxID=230839 RepID=A0ACC0WRH8_9STRA|nr:hypothetical protein PsorP6_001582 [Peronosclerospora sorghi]